MFSPVTHKAKPIPQLLHSPPPHKRFHRQSQIPFPTSSFFLCFCAFNLQKHLVHVPMSHSFLLVWFLQRWKIMDSQLRRKFLLHLEPSSCMRKTREKYKTKFVPVFVPFLFLFFFLGLFFLSDALILLIFDFFFLIRLLLYRNGVRERSLEEFWVCFHCSTSSDVWSFIIAFFPRFTVQELLRSDWVKVTEKRKRGIRTSTIILLT